MTFISSRWIVYAKSGSRRTRTPRVRYDPVMTRSGRGPPSRSVAAFGNRPQLVVSHQKRDCLLRHRHSKRVKFNDPRSCVRIEIAQPNQHNA